MKLRQVQALLDKNNIDYGLTTEPSKSEFYQNRGFQPAEDTDAFLLLTIPNPNHEKDIHIVFDGASDNPEFYDLGFGGYWYELFGFLDSELPQTLSEEIQNILDGKSYVIIAGNAKSGKWFYDGLFCDSPEEEWNDMDDFRKAVEKIKAPKNLWRKITGRTIIYEIFNWEKFERVVK